jgi:hypothetical protein
MDQDLKTLLELLKKQLAETGTFEIASLTQYFMARKSYQSMVLAMGNASPEDLVAMGVALGESWKIGNAASAANSQKVNQLGWQLLLMALEKGLTAMTVI